MTPHANSRYFLTISIACTCFALAFTAQKTNAVEPNPCHHASLLKLDAVDSASPTLDILFVGNSYTYVNNLPAMVGAMLEAGHVTAHIEKSVGGGYTLERHIKDGKAASAIASRDWDIVILQEQSMRPCVEPEMTVRYAKELDKLIDKDRTKKIFFLTWARQHIPEMQDGLNQTYYSVARQLDATVAPVGRAWKKIREASPDLALHSPDRSHPSPTGTYLAACVFYTTITGRSPVGLPAVLKTGDKQLVKLDAELAKQLQTAAWETVCSPPPVLEESGE